MTPFGRPSCLPVASAIALPPAPNLYTASVPVSSGPLGPNLMPVSVTYTVPSGPAAMSFKKVAPLISRVPSGAPVVRLNRRTASMSATKRVSPLNAIPFGPLSVTPLVPPAIQCASSILPSVPSREMNPLLSLSPGLPLMFEIR